MDKINQIDHSLKQDFRIRRPKIAVLGLNPHSGDQGVIGKEDDELIAPTIRKAFESGKLVYGPYSADSFFASDTFLQFDAVLAMYHDQGLIPVKLLAFDAAVNTTLELPFLRTSPDHGTGFDIAGHGIARPDSMVAALQAAWDLTRS